MWYTIIFVVIVAILLKNIFTEVKLASVQSADTPEVVEEGKFTPKTLAKYNGRDDKRIFLAVKGRVFDVTAGAAFYGPGGPYENFSGRDASRGLAKNSFELDCLTPLDKTIDTLSDLTKEEVESLENWEEHFNNKYRVVGVLENEQPDEKI
ncbi:Piso0_002364 [Millerozyma farinosa CBS 7064]|uniref:Piso0_002364 protein n=1 Tax=Pichia sorbitophila (strain ATCC MYA-4447 / BCRC 22081 / CBS 7064 / NBRC 10061 / NRRL Y-12695) TaxID=559304 RepID=G8YCE9_PICSO|nr:Piso0_002364 [Millerozyma farinosa CBS 7064]